VAESSLQPILALFGQPVDANPTQFMLERAFAQHELDWRFLTLEVSREDLADAVRGMRAMGFAGGKIGNPHTRAIVELLDRVEPAASLVGAVNMVVREGRELIGGNTEGPGVVAALRRVIDPSGRRVVLLGTDLLARTIGAELLRAGVGSLLVVGENEAAAVDLVDFLHTSLPGEAVASAWGDGFILPPEPDILVQATALTDEAAEEPLPLDVESLRPEVLVADVATSPHETWLLQEARRRGCPIVDGLDITCSRTALEMARWTGVQPDLTLLRDALEEFLFL
jgi:shikimate dehydrogenase